MSDFDALLKRSFAEEHHEPDDGGFSVAVAAGVARREKINKMWSTAQNAGMAGAGLAVVFGLYSIGSAIGPELAASAGLEIARAHGALSSAPTAAADAGFMGLGWLQSAGAGMLTQLLLVAGALTGGAVAYRAVRE